MCVTMDKFLTFARLSFLMCKVGVPVALSAGVVMLQKTDLAISLSLPAPSPTGS